MSRIAKGKDIVGALWSELERSEERMRATGGTARSRPDIDCYAPEIRHDQFEAPVYVAMGESDVALRSQTEADRIQGLVSQAIASMDGGHAAALSPMFGGHVTLEPAASVAGAHSLLPGRAGQLPDHVLAEPVRAAAQDGAPVQAKEDSPAKRLAAKAAGHKARGNGAPDYSEALDIAKKRKVSKPAAEPLSAAEPDYFSAPEPRAVARGGQRIEAPHALERRIEEFDIPEPRAFRDMRAEDLPQAELISKPKRKKRPLWLRILWG